MRLTDVVDGAGAELAVEELGAEVLQVDDGERPKVENIVTRESSSASETITQKIHSQLSCL